MGGGWIGESLIQEEYGKVMYKNVMNCFRSVTERSLIKTNAFFLCYGVKVFSYKFSVEVERRGELNPAFYNSDTN